MCEYIVYSIRGTDIREFPNIHHWPITADFHKSDHIITAVSWQIIQRLNLVCQDSSITASLSLPSPLFIEWSSCILTLLGSDLMQISAIGLSHILHLMKTRWPTTHIRQSQAGFEPLLPQLQQVHCPMRYGVF